MLLCAKFFSVSDATICSLNTFLNSPWWRSYARRAWLNFYFESRDYTNSNCFFPWLSKWVSAHFTAVNAHCTTKVAATSVRTVVIAASFSGTAFAHALSRRFWTNLQHGKSLVKWSSILKHCQIIPVTRNKIKHN